MDSMREVYIPSKEIEEILDNFRCINSIDMYYDVLKKGMHHYKETEGGRECMCKAVEDYVEKKQVETVKRMIAGGKLTIEEIAEYSGFSLEKIKELASKRTA